MKEFFDTVKIAAALRMARAAVGWSQVELAQRLGIAKTTLARAETMDGRLRAEQLTQLMRLYRSMGVDVDFFCLDDLQVKVRKKGLKYSLDRLQDKDLRRSDRKKDVVTTSKKRVSKSSKPNRRQADVFKDAM